MNPSFSEVESLVRTLPGVWGCRIVPDAAGGITAVHVTARGDVSASALAADIHTLLTAESPFLLTPDQVHVVVLPAEPGATPATDAGLEALEELEVEGRARILVLRTTATAEETSAEVELGFGATTALGRATCRGAALAPHLLADACLDALERLCNSRVSLRLAGTGRLAVGGSELVVALVHESDGRDERLHAGAARVEGDLARAAAYAVLAAFNRRLGRVLAAPSRQYRIG